MIILAKQPGGYNVDLACQGALEAAKAHAWDNTKIRTVGFTYLDSSIPSAVEKTLLGLDVGDRRKMLLVTDDDVHQILKREVGLQVPFVFKLTRGYFLFSLRLTPSTGLFKSYSVIPSAWTAG